MPGTFVPNGNQNIIVSEPRTPQKLRTVADVAPTWDSDPLPVRFNPKDRYDKEFTVDL